MDRRKESGFERYGMNDEEQVEEQLNKEQLNKEQLNKEQLNKEQGTRNKEQLNKERDRMHDCGYLIFAHVANTVGDYMITRLHDYMIFDVDI